MIGKTLAHYEIESLLGSGGMGEVYQARDTKLGRSVAVKVLPEAFASDPDRISRFEREARLLASLNHPNIAALHGMEQGDGRHLLIMELVEGETLAESIRRGPIAVNQALRIALQIAEALEAAHEKGVVHRDLKPANVKVTPDEKVKVLDFGLAKALDNAPVNSTLSNSPTLSMAATQAGVILGTAAYMSPEQAKGFQADARSDVFSFGCVLYEMLTGRQPFQGDTAAEVLASVLVRDAELNLLPSNINPRIAELLRRCLEKNPKRRWQAAGDLRAELELILAAPAGAVVVPQAIPRKNLWKAASIALFAGMAIFAAAAAYLYWRPQEEQLVKFSVALPEKTVLAGFTDGASVSPDGRYMVFTARDSSGRVQLWIRSLDSLSARAIPNTEGGTIRTFWSPDSRSIAFGQQGKLRRVNDDGSGIQTIGDYSQNLLGGTWNSDGVIIYAPNPAGPLHRVQATGGQTTAITKLENHTSHRFPHFLPDGRHFLYLAVGAEASEVFAGDLQSGETKRLFSSDSEAVFATGYVLFIRQGILLAQAFDTERLETIGDPIPVAEPVAYVQSGNLNGVAGFSVSANGILTYRGGSPQLVDYVRLVWVDRSGKELEQIGQPGPYRGVDLSPEGKRLAVHRHEGAGGDTWIFEPPRPTALRLTFDASQENASPLWSPDGKRIAFASLRGGMWGLYRKESDGVGEDELLFQTKPQIMPKAWSPDGKFLIYWQREATGDLWILPLDGERKPQAFLNSPKFNESHAQVSPDGKWISYNSTVSGQSEIYVRPFPSGSGRWQVSTNGGFFSRWRPDGKELFYLTSGSNGKLMSVEVKTAGSTFEYSAAKELFDSQYENYTHPSGGQWHTYAVSRDGQRFLIPRPVASGPDTSRTPFNVILNWPLLLKK